MSDYNLNSIYKLQDNKGNHLSIPVKGLIFVNPGLVEPYGVAIGDVLTLDISGTSYNFTVAEIAENAKLASVYVKADELAEILGIPSGEYNGLLSMEEVADCEKTVKKAQRIEELKRNALSSIQKSLSISTGDYMPF